jgi:hypothetical protein
MFEYQREIAKLKLTDDEASRDIKLYARDTPNPPEYTLRHRDRAYDFPRLTYIRFKAFNPTFSLYPV